MTDPYITRKNQSSDLEKAKRNGIENYKTELNEKISILEELLKGYDDGRRKSLYCTAVNLLELEDVKSIIQQIGDEVSPIAPLKEKAAVVVRLFEGIAEKRGISLLLRKKARTY